MSSDTRITSLASGMDTDALIEKLMEANRAPLTKLEKNKTKVEWQRESFLDINSKLLSFRTSALDMKLQGTYKSYTADSTDKGAISASATSDAQEGTYKVSVSELATKTSLTGTSMPLTIVSSAVISNASIASGIKGKEFKVSYNGETKTISFGENESISNFTELKDSLQTKIDDAFGANQITVAKNGFNKLSFTSATSLNLPITLSSANETEKDALGLFKINDGASTAFDTTQTLGNFLSADSFTDDEVTLTINDKEFKFAKTDTIADVFSKLNKDADADITIKYSDVKKCMTVSRDTFGEGRQLSLGGGGGATGEFWKKLGLDYYNYVNNDNVAEFEENGGSYVGGQNAVFSITSPDGEVATNIETASNNFTYNGVSMTFLEADPTNEVAITISKNVDEIYDKIKSFADSYNELLVTLNKYYKEEETGYEPLTDEERESLSETQEENWEKMAKKGILRRDATISSAISSMRSAVTSYVSNSSISSLFEIGISTVKYDAVNTENNGKMEINEEKLKAAIKNNIEGVTEVFAGTAKQIQGNKLENTNIDLDGKSFTVNYGGSKKTINLSGQYDLSDDQSRSDFEDYMKDVFEKEFGEGRVSVSVSGNKILFNSLKTVDMTFNISDEAKADSTKDALSLFGISDGAKYDTTERGFAVKIYDICTTSMNSLIDKAGSSATTVDSSTLGQQLKRLKESITKQKEKLETLEDRYYTQFAAMEEAMSNMNSQGSQLQSMLSGS